MWTKRLFSAPISLLCFALTHLCPLGSCLPRKVQYVFPWIKCHFHLNHLTFDVAWVTAIIMCLYTAHHISLYCVLYSLSSAAFSSLYAWRSCCLSSLTSLSGFLEVLCSSVLSTSACSLSSSARYLFASPKSWISDSRVLLDETAFKYMVQYAVY